MKIYTDFGDIQMTKHFQDDTPRLLKRREKSKPPKIGIIRTIKRRPPKRSHATVEFIGSGCTRLNCALSGKGVKGGWARARIGNIVGDRSAGKTAVALEACFWFYKNIHKVKSQIFPPVTKSIIVYNNSEGVMDFDIEAMYGPQFFKKVDWIRSPNIEHFGRDYSRRVDKLESGHSLIYILDTLDFLKSYKSIERFQESINKDEDTKGSYDVEKQKYLSGFFAATSKYLDKNKVDATLLIVSQVRAVMDPRSFKKEMRAGGKAFGHAIHQEAWFREMQKIRATKKGEKRVYAIKVAARVEKNKVAKPFREAEFQILYDYGVDDLNSMIDYLWGSRTINFDGQTFKNGATSSVRKEFIKYIEDNNYETLIAKKVEDKWNAVEEAFEAEVKARTRRW